jgi:thiol-disulfide isomerase/thioredoxin
MIDTRRYQWMIGGIGLLLVVCFSIYLYAHGGHTRPGVPAGRELHHFVAPLATSDLNLPANVAPHCDPARPAKQGLNVCGREPIVLEFFAIGATPCIRAVDALQQVAHRFPGVEFAAVAAGGNRRQTLAVVRSQHWSMPVAYDMTASVAALYDVTLCPMIEVAGRGGVVKRLLIGERWERPAALAATLRGVLSAHS